MWLNKLFLAKVFRRNKALFVLFCAFVTGCFYFNCKGIETTPFFIWAMFSGKMPEKQQYRIMTVSYNGDQQFNLPHTFQEPQSMMVYFTLNHYRKIEANSMMDPMQQVLATVVPHHPFLKRVANRLLSQPADNARYLPWLKNYLQSIIGTPVNDVTVFEKVVHFDSQYRVQEDSSKILYQVQ